MSAMPQFIGRPDGDRVRHSILLAVHELSSEKGYPPSMREVMERIGISSSGHLTHHVRILRAQGLLIDPGFSQARTMLLTQKGMDAIGVRGSARSHLHLLTSSRTRTAADTVSRLFRAIAESDDPEQAARICLNAIGEYTQ